MNSMINLVRGGGSGGGGGASGGGGGRHQQAKNNTRTVSGVSESLSFAEGQYLLACERGDLATVRYYLNSAVDRVDMNCSDRMGRTALKIAIENENTEMIELLLSRGVDVGDSLLHAINEENVEAVELLIRHMEDEKAGGTASSFAQLHQMYERSTFTADITPIILASQKDNYEIIKLLLDRGDKIPRPHDVRCSCGDCMHANAEDSLRLSRSRINAYRALSSPSLICLSARDPILYAFEMSWELRRLSNIENEFKSEYQELSQKCQHFAVDLLDQTRSSKELEVILNYDDADLWPGLEHAPGERMQLARLKLAVLYSQKKFVAHPNCQQLLASIWYEGLPGYRRRNIIFKMFLIMVVCLGFPFLSLMYMIAPKSAVGKFVRQPFIKFLCHSASYCTFLLLLILASQRINFGDSFSGTLNNDTDSTTAETEAIRISNKQSGRVDSVTRKERRGPAPTPVEWMIIIWIFGLIWVEVKQLWSAGLREYSRDMWNILDFITNSLYIAAIALRIIAYMEIEGEIASLPPHLQSIARLLPRADWHAWDPTLISECLFATANIFSSLKLVHIFTVNPHLGPLQISLGRMVIDILKFFVVYCLVLFAFACGLNQLFWYYATMRRDECERSKESGNTTTESERPPLSEKEQKDLEDLEKSCDKRWLSFGNLYFALESLLWATFGLIELNHLDVKENHYVTEWVGETMFGAYSMIAIVVLLNMLIAMMANSFASIDNEADTEWKFARSKLWIEYFDDSGTLPPPFNIIPAPKSVCAALKYLFECIFQQNRRQRNQRSLKLQRILKAVSQRETNYQLVLRNLVKRYVAYVQHSKQRAEGVSEDDVNEIKQEVSSLRYELLDILRKNGFVFESVDNGMYSGRKRRSADAERRLMSELSRPCGGGGTPSDSYPHLLSTIADEQTEQTMDEDDDDDEHDPAAGAPSKLAHTRALLDVVNEAEAAAKAARKKSTLSSRSSSSGTRIYLGLPPAAAAAERKSSQSSMKAAAAAAATSNQPAVRRPSPTTAVRLIDSDDSSDDDHNQDDEALVL